MKKYHVTLTFPERQSLYQLLQQKNLSRQKANRALMLLKVNQSGVGPALMDQEVANEFGVTTRTIETLRKRFVEEGFEVAVSGKGYESNLSRIKIDGKLEAHLIALSCNEPPEGYGRWSLRPLADRLVELNYIDSISHESVRQVLKKRVKALEA